MTETFNSLIDFLRVQIHTDRTLAAQALTDWVEGPDGDEMASEVKSILIGGHLVRWSPRRVLRECEAKQRILDLWVDPESVRSLPAGVHDGRDPDEVEAEVRAAEAIDQVVRIHAAVYAAQGRDGYRPEWRPE